MKYIIMLLPILFLALTSQAQIAQHTEMHSVIYLGEYIANHGISPVGNRGIASDDAAAASGVDPNLAQYDSGAGLSESSMTGNCNKQSNTLANGCGVFRPSATTKTKKKPGPASNVNQ